MHRDDLDVGAPQNRQGNQLFFSSNPQATDHGRCVILLLSEFLALLFSLSNGLSVPLVSPKSGHRRANTG